MGIPAHYIKDKNGKKFYPYAHVNAIYDNEGNLLKDSPICNKFREYPSFSSFPAIGEKGVVYIDTGGNNAIYRWDSINSKYFNIGSSLELGVKSTDAGRGDWTKIAYEHSQRTHAPETAQENIIERITVGGIEQTIENKTVALPKYPTTLPASDVYAWAKSQTKPSYTKAEIGLSEVQNVTTNNQTPTYSQASTLINLISGEKLSISMGKIMKAIAELISHIGDKVAHITSEEREKWNAVTNKVDKVTGKQLSTNDYTTIEKSKLAGISTGANVNVQSDWNVIDENSDAYIKNKPSSMPASDVLAWAKAANKPSYSWSEITNKPSTFTPIAHTHTKNQITDMPTKVSQFANDAGYITQDDVDTSQNHTHANKTVLDKITQALIDTWNGKASTATATQSTNGLMAATDKKKLDGVATGANNYVHPTASGNKHIPSGGTSGQFLKWSSDGTAVWAADNNTTYSVFSGATSSVSGKSGLVPAPEAGAQVKYLRGDGVWQTPPDTKYTHPNSGASAGIYRSVTINTQGHVTAGSNPTTLSGYGITDAAPKIHNHTKSQITDFPVSLKNPSALTISLNGTAQEPYDGSSAKNINITAAGIGAATSNSVAELTNDIEILKNGVEIDGGGASTTTYDNEYDGGGAV
ncbi:MAG: hypothetical protein LUH21_17645 [Clostridiales bacterium]|nr:hypothetical protein [Clostridiales bacterium]